MYTVFIHGAAMPLQIPAPLTGTLTAIEKHYAIIQAVDLLSQSYFGDPHSTARESDYETIQNYAGIPKDTINRWLAFVQDKFKVGFAYRNYWKVPGNCDSALSLSSRFNAVLVREFEYLPPEEQPVLSRVLPKETALRILNINYLWNYLRKMYQEKPVLFVQNLSSSTPPELDVFISTLQESALLPHNVWGLSPAFLNIHLIGAAHVQNLLLQYDYFFTKLTSNIILQIVKGEGKSAEEIFSVDGRAFSAKSILQFGIPTLGYSVTQCYNKQVDNLDSLPNPTKTEREIQVQLNLVALENALTEAAQAVQTNFDPIPLTETDIPPPIKNDYQSLQAYAKFLWDKIEKYIQGNLPEVVCEYRQDIGNMRLITSNNTNYLGEFWFNKIIGTGGLARIDLGDTNFNNPDMLTFLAHTEAFPTQNDHFLDPYNMVWLMKVRFIEDALYKFSTWTEAVKIASFLRKSVYFYIPQTVEDIEKFKGALRMIIPRLEYWYQSRMIHPGDDGKPFHEMTPIAFLFQR